MLSLKLGYSVLYLSSCDYYAASLSRLSRDREKVISFVVGDWLLVCPPFPRGVRGDRAYEGELTIILNGFQFGISGFIHFRRQFLQLQLRPPILHLILHWFLHLPLQELEFLQERVRR